MTSYIPTPFSDHLAQIVQYSIPYEDGFSGDPKARLVFKVSKFVINDNIFQENLKDSMAHWNLLCSTYHYPIL